MTHMSKSANGVARVSSRVFPSPQLVEWPKPANYEFEERAAILEFDGELSRDDAEIFARRELKLMRLISGAGEL